MLQLCFVRLICLTPFVLHALLCPSYMPSLICLICLTLFVLYAFPHSSSLPYLNFYAFRCLPPMPYLVLLGCFGSCLNIESRKCNLVLTHDFVTNRPVYRISITTILRQGRSLWPIRMVFFGAGIRVPVPARGISDRAHIPQERGEAPGKVVACS